jgi:hypothetical protein
MESCATTKKRQGEFNHPAFDIWRANIGNCFSTNVLYQAGFALEFPSMTPLMTLRMAAPKTSRFISM